MLQPQKTKTWEDMTNLAKPLADKNWAFRGQSQRYPRLTTSFERTADKAEVPGSERWNVEYTILHEFRRRAHLYLPNPPESKDLLEWLALMQHHGCATRLLDFTHSFYVAAFFALQEEIQQSKDKRSDITVWAVNLDILARKAREFDESAFMKSAKEQNLAPADRSPMKMQNNIADSILNPNLNFKDKGERPSLVPSVIAVEPYRMNERLSIQRGLFLFPTDISCSFMVNLITPFEKDVDIDTTIRKFDLANEPDEYDSDKFSKIDEDSVEIIKIILPKTEQEEALRDLRRMNITRATLFPDLDGFAGSFDYLFFEGCKDRITPPKLE